MVIPPEDQTMSCRPIRNSRALNIVPALFLQTFFFFGTVKCVGIILPEIHASLGVTTSDVGLALGLFYGFGFGPGPVMVYLYNLQTPRRIVLMMGSVLAPLGLILISLISKAEHLPACLSMAGLGSNMVSISVILSLNDQEKEHFYIFYGLGKSGYAVGMIVAPLLTDYLMQVYGWRSAVALIGAFMCNLVPLAMMIDVYPKTYPGDTSGDKEHGETSKELKGIETMEPLRTGNDTASNRMINKTINGQNMQHRSMTTDASEISSGDSSTGTNSDLEGRYRELCARTTTILKSLSSMLNRQIVVILIGTGLFSMGDGGWHSFLVPRAVGIGIPTSQALHLAYSAAAASFLGRCLSGIFLLPNCMTSLDWFLLLTIINCLSILVDILVRKYTVLIITSFLSSLSLAERGMLVVTLSKQESEQEAFPFILAGIDIVFGLGALIGTYMAGVAADVAHNFNASFVFCAIIDTVVLGLMLTSRIAEKFLRT